jgi:CheY-like chemotaxis protein
MKPRVLIVDDDADLAEAARMLLEDLGAEAHVALGGSEAVERARAEEFDLLICDVLLPRMDGWQVARAVRAVRPATRIWLMSGARVEADDPRLAAVDGLLPKPVEIDHLERLLRTVGG